MKRSILVILTLVAGLLGGAWAATLSSEVGWISTLPGVSLTVSNDTGGKVDRVYSVSGDIGTTMAAIRSGLQRRAWKIVNASDVQAPGAAVTSLIAVRGDLHLRVSLQATEGVGNMALVLESGRVSSTHTGTGPNVSEGSEGQGLVVNDNHQNITFDCRNAGVVVNGNSNNITLQGHCTSLVTNGNSNNITVDAALDAINANGNSNVIRWSGDRNAAVPRVVNNGSGNVISRY